MESPAPPLLSAEVHIRHGSHSSSEAVPEESPEHHIIIIHPEGIGENKVESQKHCNRNSKALNLFLFHGFLELQNFPISEVVVLNKE